MMALVGQLETTAAGIKARSASTSAAALELRQHQIADIGFRGARTKINGEMVDAYDAFIGGRLGKNRRFNELLKQDHRAGRAPLHRQGAETYDRLKQGDETFADFTDRVPKAEILAGLES
jgi:ferredoxin-nitrite reductase